MKITFEDLTIELTVKEFQELTAKNPISHEEFVQLGKSILTKKRGRPRKT